MNSTNNPAPAGISQYEAAKRRFQALSDQQDNLSDQENYAAIIQNFCDDEHNTIEFDSAYFFDLIYIADMIQLLDNVTEKFYTKLSVKFLLNDHLPAIIENLDYLDRISHVYQFIIQGLCKALQLKPIIQGGELTLQYSTSKLWYDVNFKETKKLILDPSGFKVLLSNDLFKFSQMNIMFRLLKIEELSLKGCNLNSCNLAGLFDNLQLKSLNMDSCGSSVNGVLRDQAKNLKTLVKLDISYNDIEAETFEIIETLQLKELYAKECINRHTHGKTIGGAYQNKVDCLQQEQIYQTFLRSTLDVLDFGENSIDLENLKKIASLNYIHLDISGCYSNTLNDVIFSTNLRVLIIRETFLNLNQFEIISDLELVNLAFECNAADFHNVASVNYAKPLFKTLQHLHVCICEDDPSRAFLQFLAQFPLKSASFASVSEEFYLEIYLKEYLTKFNYLESLIVKGYEFYPEEPISPFLSRLHLKKVMLDTDVHNQFYREVLKTEGLEQHLKELYLSSCLTNDDLLDITKFKNLNYLRFQFDHNVSEEHLKEIMNMNIKYLVIEAVVRGALDLPMARKLCIAKPKTLTIYDDYGKAITQPAFEFLIDEANCRSFSENLATLCVRNVLTQQMATILNCPNWQNISMDSSYREGSMAAMFENPHLKYTVDYFKCKNFDETWDLVAIEKLNPSSLELEAFSIRNEILEILKTKKFLRTLIVNEYKENPVFVKKIEELFHRKIISTLWLYKIQRFFYLHD